MGPLKGRRLNKPGQWTKQKDETMGAGVEQGFRWSFSLKSEVDGATSHPEKWAFDRCFAYPIGEGKVVVRSRRNHAATILTVDVLEALKVCRPFRTVEGHIAAIEAAFPDLSGQTEELRQVLAQVVEAGLMRRAADAVAMIQQPPNEANRTDTEPLSVYVRTCERPDNLNRLLESLAKNELHHGGRHHYTVLDDSKQEDTRKDNREVVSGFAHVAGMGVDYCGMDAQQELADQLCQAFPEHEEEVRWLLQGEPGKPSYGVPWNQLLLRTAGRRALLVDDDVVMSARRAPIQTLGVGLESQREAVFFPDRDGLRHQASEVDFDPIREHGRVLGMPVGTVLNDVYGTALTKDALDGLTVDDIHGIAGGSPVLMTTNSVFGDPGTSGVSWLYDLNADSRKRFTPTQDAYEKNRTARNLWFGASRLQFVAGGYLMTTTATGLDNTRMLPPTLPAFRNEDAIFGAVARLLHPDSVTARFPWGLLHLPEPARQWQETALDRPEQPNLVQFMADVVTNILKSGLAGSTADSRMRALGELLIAMGDAPVGRLQEYIDEYVVSLRADMARRMNQRLDEAEGEPEYWARDAQRVAQANARSLIEQTDGFELLGDNSEGVSIDTVRHYCRRYGRALRLWPDLWEFCRERSHK